MFQEGWSLTLCLSSTWNIRFLFYFNYKIVDIFLYICEHEDKCNTFKHR